MLQFCKICEIFLTYLRYSVLFKKPAGKKAKIRNVFTILLIIVNAALKACSTCSRGRCIYLPTTRLQEFEKFNNHCDNPSLRALTKINMRLREKEGPWKIWNIFERKLKFYEHWKFQRNRSIPLEEDKLDNFNMYEMLDKLKTLLQYAIFLSTCLAISLGQKLHESLPSVTCSKMNMSRNFLLPQSLREVEVDSTSRNGDCNKNVARHVHFKACYTRQRFG